MTTATAVRAPTLAEGDGTAEVVTRCGKFSPPERQPHCPKPNTQCVVGFNHPNPNPDPNPQCVVGFDHHCDFINQCVGSSNYTMWCTFVFMLWFMAATELVFTLSGMVKVTRVLTPVGI